MKNTMLIGSLLLLGAALLQAQPTKKTAVAVMPLRGSAVSDADAKFLTERLTIELQRAGVYDVMERDRMAEILKEQGFQQTGACDETACLVEAGRLLPVEKMIGGSVGQVGGVFSAQIRLIDLKTGAVERTATRDYKGELDYLLTVGMHETAAELSGKLGPQAQAQAAAAAPQTEAMMKKLMEAEADRQSKSGVSSVIWSFFLPGAGHIYAHNYWVGAGFAAARLVTFSNWAAKLKSGEMGAKKFWGITFLAAWTLDCVTSPRSVRKYNVKLRKKYGLTSALTPFDQRPALALTGTF